MKLRVCVWDTEWSRVGTSQHADAASGQATMPGTA